MKTYIFILMSFLSIGVYAGPPCGIFICSGFPSNSPACERCNDCRDSGGSISLSESGGGIRIDCNHKEFVLESGEVVKSSQINEKGFYSK
jgi:hypothetical protein